MKTLLLSIIGLYQKYLSPDHSWWAKKRNNPPFCKHFPTCSEYTKEAIQKKGTLKGSYMGLKRVLRCMPWNKGGYDPVKDNN